MTSVLAVSTLAPGSYGSGTGYNTVTSRMSKRIWDYAQKRHRKAICRDGTHVRRLQCSQPPGHALSSLPSPHSRRIPNKSRRLSESPYYSNALDRYPKLCNVIMLHIIPQPACPGHGDIFCTRLRVIVQCKVCPDHDHILRHHRRLTDWGQIRNTAIMEFLMQNNIFLLFLAQIPRQINPGPEYAHY